MDLLRILEQVCSELSLSRPDKTEGYFLTQASRGFGKQVVTYSIEPIGDNMAEISSYWGDSKRKDSAWGEPVQVDINERSIRQVLQDNLQLLQSAHSTYQKLVKDVASKFDSTPEAVPFSYDGTLVFEVDTNIRWRNRLLIHMDISPVEDGGMALDVVPLASWSTSGSLVGSSRTMYFSSESFDLEHVTAQEVARRIQQEVQELEERYEDTDEFEEYDGYDESSLHSLLKSSAGPESIVERLMNPLSSTRNNNGKRRNQRSR